MPATLSVKQATGAAPTYTTATSVRQNSDDTANPGTNNPLVKPTSGTNYGFWKSFCLNVDVAPAVQVNNIRFFTPGSLGWTGVVLYGNSASGYTQATGTIGITGDQLTLTAYPQLAGAPVLATGWTSGSPLTVPGTLTNINDKSNFVVLQANVSTSAVAGSLAAVTCTFRYDEV